MKKLIGLLCLIISFTVHAQKPGYFGGSKTSGWEARSSLWATGYIYTGHGRAIGTPIRSGAVVFDTIIKKLYYHNGTIWVPFGGDDNAVFAQQPLYKDANTIKFNKDSSGLVSILYKKLNTDTVLQRINGVDIFAFTVGSPKSKDSLVLVQQPLQVFPSESGPDTLRFNKDSSGLVKDIYKKAGTDSVYKMVNGVWVFAFKDSVGSGSGGGSKIIYIEQQGTLGDSLVTVKNDTTLSSARIRGMIGIITGYAPDGSYVFKVDTSYLKNFFGGVTANRIAFGSSTNNIISDSALQFNPTGIRTSTNAALRLTPRLSAIADGDKLVGFSIAPTYIAGSRNGVIKSVFEINGNLLNVDSSRVFSLGTTTAGLPIANSNVFGSGAGIATGNTSQEVNFFGFNAGGGATNASYSNYFGSQAGYGATNANRSNFIGRSAGSGATGADQSNFFGQNAGYGATGARGSNFFGFSAGYGATGAYNSIFIGQNAGYSGTHAITGSNNILIGNYITTPTGASKNMMSLGNVIYATNLNKSTDNNPIKEAMVNGHVGINNNNPDTSAALDITGYKYGLLIPRMTSNDRLSITTGIASGAISGVGSGYTPGTYTGIALTGGTGSGAVATVRVSAGGAVDLVTIEQPGRGFLVGDVLSASGIGSGSGFTYTISNLQKGAKSLMVMDTTINKLSVYNGTYWFPEGGISNSYSTSATSQSTFTVTIGATLGTSAYKAQVTPTNSLSAAPLYVTNKTATTFDVVYLSPLTGTVGFDWYISN